MRLGGSDNITHFDAATISHCLHKVTKGQGAAHSKQTEKEALKFPVCPPPFPPFPPIFHTNYLPFPPLFHVNAKKKTYHPWAWRGKASKRVHLCGERCYIQTLSDMHRPHTPI